MTDQGHAPENVKRINVALQGGGAHGAFSWGVLDKLLEDGRLAIEGLSGTSAGSMKVSNPVMRYPSVSSSVTPCGGGGPSSARRRITTAGRPFARVGVSV